jgi:hypothetical protein
MKQVLIVLVITAFAYTSAEAQTACQPPVHKHRTAAKHKSTSVTRTTTTACRMVPYQVCTILPDRRHVSCYTTTDSSEQKQTGGTTVYGPTGAMPGEIVKFKVRTIVEKGESKGSFCKRNKDGSTTACYEPGGLILRDENGNYSYGEPAPQNETGRVTAK